MGLPGEPNSLVLAGASDGYSAKKFMYSGRVEQGGSKLERLAEASGRFLLKHWKRVLAIRNRLRVSEDTFHLILAGIVGLIGGITNRVFLGLANFLMNLFLGRSGDLGEIAHVIPIWQRVLIPAAGALGAGLTLFYGLKLVRNQGATNIIEVVVTGDGRLAARNALVKGASSLMSIATGASIGREGAITQITATIASKVGQFAGWQPYRLRMLVACGAASGIAAAYNAPISGAVFAAYIVLGNFSMNYFLPLIFASVVATMLSRTFFGLSPWYEVGAHDFTSLSQLPWFLVLGVLCGTASASFLKFLRYSEDAFTRLKWPIYYRMALGGLLVGCIAIAYPDVWGNGYGAIHTILTDEPELVFVVGLFLAKLLATSITVGSGAIGGVLTPTLLIGAAMGAGFSTILKMAGWSHLPSGVFSLVAMGSVLAATTHAPLLAIILVFEISLNYSLMPPLMISCALATLVGRRLHRESIYTEPLRIKSLVAQRENQTPGSATERVVGEMMRSPVQPVRDNATLQEIAQRFLTSTYNFLPVVDANKKLVGIMALHDLKEHLNAGEELRGIIAMDLMRPPPQCLTPDQRLIDVLPLLLASDLRNVPVVDNCVDYRLVGSVQRAEAIAHLSEALALRQQRD